MPEPTYVYSYATARGVTMHLFAGRAGAGGTLVTKCGRRFVGWGTDTVPPHGHLCRRCARYNEAVAPATADKETPNG